MQPQLPKKPVAKLYGLIRDKDGFPKIEGNPQDLHPAIKAMLTPQERAKLGLD